MQLSVGREPRPAAVAAERQAHHGWERGDASLLGTQVARLSRLAHRVVWVNPHAGRAGYSPVQGGIVAALPHLDALLAGHSLATLEELMELIRDA